MANYMLVHHRVRNFTEWKAGFDTHLPKRNEAGLSEKFLLHGINDPNDVTILFEASDLKTAKGFAESADLKETMQKVGVVSMPEINFYTT